MPLTTYIVFEKVEASIPAEEPEGGGEIGDPVTIEAFRKIDAVNAHSVDQALRKAAEKHGSGSYAATSQRAWKTQDFEVATRVVVKAASG